MSPMHLRDNYISAFSIFEAELNLKLVYNLNLYFQITYIFATAEIGATRSSELYLT